MTNHINKLVEATKSCEISYRPAYSLDGKPDIGVRMHPQDMILIDDMPWLISGDIYNGTTNEKINEICRVSLLSLENLRVRLLAQAIICGKIVQVHLGSYTVKHRFKLGNEGGTLKIIKDNYE